jgi:uncharacterized membrane protein YgdD (TMEM256/DUF423 family)
MAVTRAQRIAAVGAASAGVAVALGAFGAHGLADVLSAARLATFETAVRYQFLHAIALLVLSQSSLPEPSRLRSALLLGGGNALFSGSLYALVASDVGAWGAVAPIGGALMIAGWGAWAIALARSRP